MKQVEIALARLNLNISINRLLFRAKLSDLTNEKLKVIQSEANDLKEVLEVFKTVCLENEEYYKEISRLKLEILYLKKELIKQQEDEIL